MRWYLQSAGGRDLDNLNCVFRFLTSLFFWLGVPPLHWVACGVLVSQSGIEPKLPVLESGVLTTGRPEKSPAAAAAKSLQSCPTLCDPIAGSPTGFPVPGILQARTLEWVAISFSNAWKWKVKVKSFSRVQLSETPWTAAYQAPPSMGFSRQEYWSGVPLLSPCIKH